MTVKCGRCACDVEIEQRRENTSPGGAKYYSVELCGTCRALYRDLLEVIQDSLRHGLRKEHKEISNEKAQNRA